VLNPGTPSQIVLNLIICIFSMKMYATYSPFVNAKADKLAEITQYQLFFTMLAALCIKVDISEEDNYNQRMFDMCLSGLQLTGPVLLVYQGFVQGGAKGAALNTETGGAMDDVRAMARSYSDAKGAAKELEMSSLGKRFGRQLRAMSSGIKGNKAELGGGGEQGGRLDEARRKWDGEGEVVEMRGNPLREGGEGGGGAKGDVDRRHLARAMSGGFPKKPTGKGGRLGKNRGVGGSGGIGGGVVPPPTSSPPEAAEPAPPPPPTPVEAAAVWTKHIDGESGHPFYEDKDGLSVWDEPFQKEWNEELGGWSWRSLVDGRIQSEEPVALVWE
jgi:hypothetical protein